MADQKALKKRLKELMNRPENQVCSDCNERQPRWASLIVPPPGAPEGSLAIGAFCCLECSGSHRRLGVHISFVRSVNLDSWKEKEVLAMENGGNAKVNAIFEARLDEMGGRKPTNHADGQTRERFIRDKYERRKYYDPAAFAQRPPESARPASMTKARSSRQIGQPSDAARQRIEERKTRQLKKSYSASSDSGDSSGGKGRKPPRRAGSSASRGGRRGVAKAPSSAPVEMDLLDLMSDPVPATGPSQGSRSNLNADPFDLMNASANENQPSSETPAPSHQKLPPSRSLSGRLSRSQNQKAPPRKAVSDDIMSLYNASSQPRSFQNHGGMMNNGGAAMNSSNVANVTAMMQTTNFQPLHPNPMMQQQTQQGNLTQAQMQQMMFQQHMLMQMKQQGMQQQQQHFMMPQGNMMMQSGDGHGQFPQQNNSNNMMMMQQSNDGGFGSPMGSGPPISTVQVGGGGGQSSPRKQAAQPEKEDPFAQFGKNVFRS